MRRAKSRAQVVSPDERKAELRARFAKAPARVRQLQKDTEVDPESVVRGPCQEEAYGPWSGVAS